MKTVQSERSKSLQLRAARSLALALAGAAAFFGASSSCGVAQDPEALSQRVVEAAYERNTGFLYDHASLTLRSEYGGSEEGFAAAAEKQISEAGLPEGEFVARGAQLAGELMGQEAFEVVGTDPDGEQRVVFVQLKPGDGTYSYCYVSLRPSGDDALEVPTSILGEGDTC
jgi:hypothetical protein